MLTRRHIRVKVMQALYTLKNNPDTDKTVVEKFLARSMDDMYDLFLLNLSFLVQLKAHADEIIEISKKKYLATERDIDPNLKFVRNQVLNRLENHELLNEQLEKRALNDWSVESGYVQLVWEELKDSDLYKNYMSFTELSFREDKDFVIALFKEFVAPNQKIHDYLEDKKITWMDDLAIVNTAVVKMLSKIKEQDNPVKLPRLYKNKEDRDFGLELFTKTLNYSYDFEEEISEKTPNWDKDRLAEIDAILIKMALCEFTRFPSIPVKVSINEYIEIAKEYSTGMSSVFINGVLDRISKVYEKEGKLNKSGRGLL